MCTCVVNMASVNEETGNFMTLIVPVDISQCVTGILKCVKNCECVSYELCCNSSGFVAGKPFKSVQIQHVLL